MRYPESIQKLIGLLAHLPSVGPKTAERYVLYLLKQPQSLLEELAQATVGLKRGLTVCSNCRRISDTSPCSICQDQKRDHSVVCVVAETKDLLALENTGRYNGLYHVLGGVINTVKQTAPSEQNIAKLTERLTAGAVKEVILALNPDLEGETTCLYLARLLNRFPVKLTKLARGLPTGSSLDYADDATLTQALNNRRDYVQ